MGSCFSRYDSIVIKKTKVTQRPDGTRERYVETTHSRTRDIECIMKIPNGVFGLHSVM